MQGESTRSGGDCPEEHRIFAARRSLAIFDFGKKRLAMIDYRNDI